MNTFNQLESATELRNAVQVLDLLTHRLHDPYEDWQPWQAAGGLLPRAFSLLAESLQEWSASKLVELYYACNRRPSDRYQSITLEHHENFARSVLAEPCLRDLLRRFLTAPGFASRNASALIERSRLCNMAEDVGVEPEIICDSRDLIAKLWVSVVTEAGKDPHEVVRLCDEAFTSASFPKQVVSKSVVRRFLSRALEEIALKAQGLKRLEDLLALAKALNTLEAECDASNFQLRPFREALLQLTVDSVGDMLAGATSDQIDRLEPHLRFFAPHVKRFVFEKLATAKFQKIAQAIQASKDQEFEICEDLEHHKLTPFEGFNRMKACCASIRLAYESWSSFLLRTGSSWSWPDIVGATATGIPLVHDGCQVSSYDSQHAHDIWRRLAEVNLDATWDEELSWAALDFASEAGVADEVLKPQKLRLARRWCQKAVQLTSFDVAIAALEWAKLEDIPLEALSEPLSPLARRLMREEGVADPVGTLTQWRFDEVVADGPTDLAAQACTLAKLLDDPNLISVVQHAARSRLEGVLSRTGQTDFNASVLIAEQLPVLRAADVDPADVDRAEELARQRLDQDLNQAWAQQDWRRVLRDCNPNLSLACELLSPAKVSSLRNAAIRLMKAELENAVASGDPCRIESLCDEAKGYPVDTSKAWETVKRMRQEQLPAASLLEALLAVDRPAAEVALEALLSSLASRSEKEQSSRVSKVLVQSITQRAIALVAATKLADTGPHLETPSSGAEQHPMQLLASAFDAGPLHAAASRDLCKSLATGPKVAQFCQALANRPIFDQKGHRAFSSALNDYGMRGDCTYFKPTGWLRWGLTVEDFERVKSWPVCYHGTAKDSVLSILMQGLRRPGEEGVAVVHGQAFSSTGRSIYASPSIEYAAFPVYAQFFELAENHWAQVAFQCRVKPGSFRQHPGTLFSKYWPPGLRFDRNFPSLDRLEWLVEDSADIVVCGLMIREFGAAADPQLYGTLATQVTADGGIRKRFQAGEGPQFHWTHLRIEAFRAAGLGLLS